MKMSLSLTLMLLLLLFNSKTSEATSRFRRPKPLPAQRWCLRAGDTLKGTLERWAQQAIWSLQWQVSYDYPITITSCFTGSFVQMLESVSQAYQGAEQPLYFNLYPRQRLLVITP